MAGYIGASPVPQTIQKKETFTATAGQTTFNTTGYTDGNFINVFLNGVRLVNGTDYTATNGSDIVLATAASASDVLDFETFNEFQLSDQEFADSVIIENNTTEDSDGGRASKLVYKGKQSGGEQSTLAEIQASHDGTADDQKGDLIFRTNDGSDGTSPTEAARIDSGQNLLVASSDPDPSANSAGSTADNGVAITNVGEVRAARFLSSAGSGAVGLFNRTGTDGDVLRIRKNGSDVGSISTSGGDMIVGTGTSRLAFFDATPAILPSSSDTFGASDGAIDLGNDGRRYKDLYLSGGAYIGGTGAANYLDDYEEGTWTPVLQFGGAGSSSSTGVTYTAQVGRYTKVGKKVTIEGGVAITARGSSTGDFNIGGLPFTQEDTGPFSDAVVAFGFVNATTLPSQQLLGLIARGTTQIFPREVVNGSMTTVPHGDLTNNSSFIFLSTYFTAS